MKSYRIFALTAALTLFTFQFKPADVYAQVRAAVPTLDFEVEAGVQSKDVERRKELYRKTNAMIQPFLKVPPKMTVVMDKTSDFPFADVQGNDEFTIEAPLQFKLVEGVLKHPVKSDPIFVHEYGHAIFETAIVNSKAVVSRLNDYIEVRPLQKRSRELAIRLFQLISIPETVRTPRDLAEIRAIRTESKVLEEKINRFAPAHGRFSEVIGSYHELFADVVAIALSQDPRAIFDAMFFQKAFKQLRGKKEEEAFRLNFDWRRFNGAPKIEDDESGVSPHNLFATVRGELWRLYLSDPCYKPRMSVVLKTIADTMIEDALTEFELDLHTSVFARNEMLQKRLDNELPKLVRNVRGCH